MNERIAKLYDQAIIIEDGGDYVCGELDHVKFAELIVGECTDLVQKYMTRWPEDHELTKQIKEHFGVEE
jgi:hypothetical protein